MFSCDEIRDLLGDHAEGTLPGELRCQVDDHLESCEECGQLRQTLDLIEQTLPDLDLLERTTQVFDFDAWIVAVDR